jgi:hypothetical protein
MRNYQRVTPDPSEQERAFLAQLNDDLDDLERRVMRLVRKKTVVTTKIRAGGTEVKHRLGRVPSSYRVMLKGDARVWEYKSRTAEFLYLKSSTDVDAEVEVEV